MLPKTLRRALLVTCRTIAEDVGRRIARRSTPTRGQVAWRKGEGDFVTAVDMAAERRIRRLLHQRHPEHGFLGEESGGARLDARLVWVVDPIDGTSNFARGLRPFGVSIACLGDGQPVAAAVRCEPEAVTYSAALGLGAYRGRSRIRRPSPTLDDRAILGVQWIRGAEDVPFLPDLLRSGARIRNLGCTVAQLCDVAMGRLDANVQVQGKIWDIAAAGLIAAEAGCMLTGWKGKPLFPFASLDGALDHPSVAAAPPVHARLVAMLRRYAPVVSPA